ncbi:MAG: alkaline phosphatase family protein [Candidatus Dormibacteria bacterium]
MESEGLGATSAHRLNHLAAVTAARTVVALDAVTRPFFRAVDTNISYLCSGADGALKWVEKHVSAGAAGHLRDASGIEPTVLSRTSHMPRPKRWRVAPLAVLAEAGAPPAIGVGKIARFILDNGLNPDPAAQKGPVQTTRQAMASAGLTLDHGAVERAKKQRESMKNAGTDQIFPEGSTPVATPRIARRNARTGVPNDAAVRAAAARAGRDASKIKHVVVIMQENHTYDDYFGRLKGGNGDADLFTASDPPQYTFPWSPTHGKWSWEKRRWMAVHEQRDEYQLPLYYRWAREQALLDDFHCYDRGPSTGNHIAHFGKWAHNLLGNPYKGVTGTIVDAFQGQPERPPFDMDSIPHHLEAADRTWANYGSGAFSDILNIKDSPNNLLSGQFAVDAKQGKLRDVSFVVAPEMKFNEHSPEGVRAGMEWVGRQVQAVIDGGHWEDTAILITWDDYGGYNDHSPPPLEEMWKHDPSVDYALGPRVPLMVLSPYAKQGYLWRDDKGAEPGKHRSFLSIPALIEHVFGIDGMPWNDSRPAWMEADADNLLGVFDFHQTPNAAPDTSLPAEVKRGYLSRVQAAWREAGNVGTLADLRGLHSSKLGLREALDRMDVEKLNIAVRAAPTVALAV